MSEERRDRIGSMVDEQGYVTIEELSRKLGTSQATLRTDLETLDKEGRLIRLRGVAISRRYGNRLVDNPGDSRAKLARDLMSREKHAIAKRCLRLLSPRDTIFLDASNTNFILAQELGKTPGIPLTVLTNSLDIFQELRLCTHVNTVLSGGDYEMSTNSLVGEHAIQFILGFYANYAFITARGFDLDTGITAYYSRNTAVRRAMRKNAAKTVIVSDHSKFSSTGVELLCPWSDINYLVCDQPPPEAYREVLRRHGIQLALPE